MKLLYLYGGVATAILIGVRGYVNITVGNKIAKHNLIVYKDSNHVSCPFRCSEKLEYWVNQPLYYKFLTTPPICDYEYDYVCEKYH